MVLFIVLRYSWSHFTLPSSSSGWVFWGPGKTWDLKDHETGSRPESYRRLDHSTSDLMFTVNLIYYIPSKVKIYSNRNVSINIGRRGFTVGGVVTFLECQSILLRPLLKTFSDVRLYRPVTMTTQVKNTGLLVVVWTLINVPVDVLHHCRERSHTIR